MIDQLLDVARARLAGGIAVAQDREHDLAALVAKVVDELREAHPGRAIELRSDGPCEAFVDADRLEQVASNLLGNALTYGDPARPVEVAVGALEGRASVRVRNFGTPIDPSFLPWLFDPFRRGPRQHGRPDGLGLGLYICERIVRAHGGTIEVESSADAGTRFEIALPRRP